MLSFTGRLGNPRPEFTLYGESMCGESFRTRPAVASLMRHAFPVYRFFIGYTCQQR